MNDSRQTRANIVIVPTTTSYELESTPRERAPRKRKTAAVPTQALSSKPVLQQLLCLQLPAGASKTTHVTAYSDATYSPSNYLVSGGARAAARDRDEQLMQLNRAAIKVGKPAPRVLAFAQQTRTHILTLCVLCRTYATLILL